MSVTGFRYTVFVIVSPPINRHCRCRLGVTDRQDHSGDLVALRVTDREGCFTITKHNRTQPLEQRHTPHHSTVTIRGPGRVISVGTITTHHRGLPRNRAGGTPSGRIQCKLGGDTILSDRMSQIVIKIRDANVTRVNLPA